MSQKAQSSFVLLKWKKVSKSPMIEAAGSKGITEMLDIGD